MIWLADDLLPYFRPGQNADFGLMEDIECCWWTCAFSDVAPSCSAVAKNICSSTDAPGRTLFFFCPIRKPSTTSAGELNSQSLKKLQNISRIGVSAILRVSACCIRPCFQMAFFTMGKKNRCQTREVNKFIELVSSVSNSCEDEKRELSKIYWKFPPCSGIGSWTRDRWVMNPTLNSIPVLILNVSMNKRQNC